MLHLEPVVRVHGGPCRAPEVFTFKPAAPISALSPTHAPIPAPAPAPSTSAATKLGRKDLGPLRHPTAVRCPKSVLNLLHPLNQGDEEDRNPSLETSPSPFPFHGQRLSPPGPDLGAPTWRHAPTGGGGPLPQRHHDPSVGATTASHPHPMNGQGRSSAPSSAPAMTGSNNPGSESLSWLADVATSPHSSPSATARLHEPPALMPATGSLFRPPITISSTAEYPSASPGQPRLYSQYPTIHGSTYYSLAHTQSSQTSNPHAPSLNPYNPYYPLQFQGNTYSHPHNPVLSRPYTQIDPAYSSMLATMGTHPRTAFLASPYSPLTVATTTPSSPGYQSQQRGVAPTFATQPIHAPYSGSGSSVDLPSEPRSPSSDRSRVRHTPPTPPTPRGEGKSLGRSPTPPPPLRPHPKSCIVKDVLLKPEPRAVSPAFYRLPCGKEGSLKHRILTRPPDINIDHSAFLGESTSTNSLDPPTSARSAEDHPSPKRCKASPLGSLSASMPSTPLRATAPVNWRTPSPVSTSSAFAVAHQSPAMVAPLGLANVGVAGPFPFPAHFTKGSVIQLASGELRRVEDMRTEDFLSSAEQSDNLKVDSSTVVRIDDNVDSGTCMLSFSVGEQRVQVTVEAALEHPFFVFGQGWSSIIPDRTLQRYSLSCHKLQVGDVCISLTHREVTGVGIAVAAGTGAGAGAGHGTATGGRSGAGLSMSHATAPLNLPPPGPMVATNNSNSSHAVVMNQNQRSERGGNGACSASASVPVSDSTTGSQPATHSIETQTSAAAANGNGTIEPKCWSSDGQQPQQRKRRWSAPDKLNESAKAKHS